MIEHAATGGLVFDAAWEHAPWMWHAFRELGVREVPGHEDNPRIQEYIASVVGQERSKRIHDETPWCSAFCSWVLGHDDHRGSGSLAARSWLKWGRDAKPEEGESPIKGCLVVLWRKKRVGPYGHVAFYVDEQRVNNIPEVILLGGNQGNAVSIRSYPRRRVLGYRMPT